MSNLLHRIVIHHYSTKMIRLFFGLVLLILLFSLGGCELFDAQEQIPAYIRIERIDLIDNPDVDEGTLSNRIVDAWIFIDDKLIGAFELPCTVPVLLDGEHEIAVYAGIYLNGVKTTRVYYPFYDPWKEKITLSPDSITTLSPKVSYSTSIKLPLHETFELGGVLIEEGLKSLAKLEKTDLASEVFQGNYSGKIVLTSTDTIWEGVSIQPFKLPSAGGHVFVELDYKTDADILVGLYAIKASTILQLEVAGILPRSDWSKIYINLTPTVFRHNDAIEFKLFFGSVKSSDATELKLLIDNVKLIHF
jgi:hypothetical protein